MNFILKSTRPVIFLIAFSLAIIIYYLNLNPEIETLEQINLASSYAQLAILFLYITLLQTPLYSVFPNLPGRVLYVKAKRALGVSAFFFAFLHVRYSFFYLLGGFEGWKFLNTRYETASLLGLSALFILSLMAGTSYNAAVKYLGPKWKRLHQGVYIAGLVIVVHALMIGTDFADLSRLKPRLYLLALTVLFFLEFLRIDKIFLRKYPRFEKYSNFLKIIVLMVLVLVYLKFTASDNPLSIHGNH